MYGEHWYQNPQWVLVGITAVYVLVTIVYAIFAGLQWRAIRRQAQSTEQLVQMSQTGERAWVGLEGTVSVLGPLPIQAGPAVAFEVAVMNSGKTPALEVTTRIMTRSYPIGADFIADYPPLPGALPHYGGTIVIQPGMRVTLRTQPTIPLTQAEINALRDNQIVLYVYGEIAYKDIFQRAHHTTFCMFLHPTLDRMSACRTYNTAD